MLLTLVMQILFSRNINSLLEFVFVPESSLFLVLNCSLLTQIQQLSQSIAGNQSRFSVFALFSRIFLLFFQFKVFFRSYFRFASLALELFLLVSWRFKHVWSSRISNNDWFLKQTLLRLENDQFFSRFVHFFFASLTLCFVFHSFCSLQHATLFLISSFHHDISPNYMQVIPMVFVIWR